ncbi:MULTISPECIES: DUF1963 domain-containing protein [Streptomyces]|uniref:DUF1963 domain-containing protein n=1 Tax=Streptomyces doudnae TaxID=3075536 RepID=A0ABD5F2Y1_9ACTN|nr:MULTISPECIES: DUF1963 domain-containing protein [unclassified Streptomyces]MDT0440289.1 DUF1963 domain-containing protein [Streptomyces sp. DSM 41981]MYQ62038.1 hypothetical protein [Streptomyces sp. SID4950]
MNMLEEFRKRAGECNMPDKSIEYWVGIARPCLCLRTDGEGPVVGYFGGRPALPKSVAWPAGHAHLASLDLASIPKGATDLDLPAEGTLVFMAVPGLASGAGRVIYAPTGVALTEAEPPGDGVSEYARTPLHGVPDWSMPESAYRSPRYLEDGQRDDEDLFEEIVWELEGPNSLLILGGFGVSNTGGLGVPIGEHEELLAEFFLQENEVGEDFETDYTTVFYGAARDDLTARNFDAAWMATDFHG